MQKRYFCYLIIILLSSCEEVFLGPDEPNTAAQNFDLLWEDFDKHYALFHVKEINWDSLYQVYRPRVSSETTDHQLWEIMSELLEHLDDSHTVLYFREDRRAHTSGFALGRKAKEEEFSLSLIKRSYVDDLTKIQGEGDLSYGKIKGKDIGYILLKEENGNDPEGAIEKIIERLRGYKAIIVDIRTNDGGRSLEYPKIIAGAFSDGERLIATLQTRNGPKHSDFNEKSPISTQKTGSQQFLKPVILLTDRATISGGEYFALHMKSFAHVTHIGDTTSGDFSAVSTRRFLPNGWTYQYSIMMLLKADGKSPEGIGLIPDVLIKNTKADIDKGEDKVLEEAFEYLLNHYGIE